MHSTVMLQFEFKLLDPQKVQKLQDMPIPWFCSPALALDSHLELVCKAQIGVYIDLFGMPVPVNSTKHAAKGLMENLKYGYNGNGQQV